MEKKRVMPIWLTVVFIVVCLGALALNVIAASKAYVSSLSADNLLTDTVLMINYITNVLAFLFAVLYGFYGYGKNAAACYSFVLISMLFTDFISVLATVGNKILIPTAMGVISVACLSVLFMAENLGKKKSYTLAIVLCITYIVRTIVFICQNAFSKSYNAIVTNIAFALVCIVLVYAKYKDKKLRKGTDE
ncbi:MAG: hypothetical protein MJ080_03240 [Clostridia bacterium]|nr:hypothetical protein [Clostridia bacterium]